MTIGPPRRNRDRATNRGRFAPTLQVRLSRLEMEALRRVADARGQTMSDVARAALDAAGLLAPPPRA